MIKKIKDWVELVFNKKQEKTREESEVKQFAEFEGHKFYVLDAAPDHCVNRFFAFISRSEQINNLGVPLQYISTVANQLDAVGKDPVKYGNLLPALSQALKAVCQVEENKWYQMTLAIIDSFVLIDDEPLLTMSPTHNELKRQLLHGNPDARFFFTNIATEYLMKLDSTFGNLNLEEYLAKRMVGYETIENIMTQKIPE